MTELESIVPLAAGEAFTRATTLEYARHCVVATITRDRLHHASQGWVQRERAATEFQAQLRAVLAELRVPSDSGALISITLGLWLDRWQEG